MSEIRVKYQVTNDEGEVVPSHSTYSPHAFATVEEAQQWIDEEGEEFTCACYIDSEALGFDELADELLIVKINGFPVVNEEVLA